MKYSWLVLIGLLGAVPARAAEPPVPAPLRLLVPAYFYPEGRGLDEWKRMARAAKDVPIVAIANPASGPGSRQDPSYTAAIDLARAAGVTVIGYVSTRYGKRPQAEVRTDIDRWLQYYPEIDGFFFDEQASSKEGVPYYEAIAGYVQTKRQDAGALVVTNPGTVTASDYLAPWKGIHVTCLYENHGGLDGYQVPAWAPSLPAANLAGLVYGEASLARMRENMRLAASKHLGFLYVTDDSGNNPWDRLPTYWELEVAELRRLYPRGVCPGLSTVVPQIHWAYDAVQQLAQRGIFTGYPDGTIAGKRAYTRLQFGGFVRNMLEQISRFSPPAPLQHPKPFLKQDLRALEFLAREFQSEVGLHGVTAEGVAAIIQKFAELLGWPKRS